VQGIGERGKGQGLKRIEAALWRRYEIIEHSGKIVGEGNTKEPPQEEGASADCFSALDFGMPGRQQRQAACQKEQLHAEPARFGRALDGGRQFGKLARHVGRDHHEHGVTPSTVHVGKVRFGRRLNAHVGEW